MRIAFITDLHIDADGEKPQGVDVRQNFLNALAFPSEYTVWKGNLLVGSLGFQYLSGRT